MHKGCDRLGIACTTARRIKHKLLAAMRRRESRRGSQAQTAPMTPCSAASIPASPIEARRIAEPFMNAVKLDHNRYHRYMRSGPIANDQGKTFSAWATSGLDGLDHRSGHPR